MSTTTITVGAGTPGSVTELTLSGTYDIDMTGIGGLLNVTGTAQTNLTADIAAISGLPVPFTDYVNAGATEIFDPAGSTYIPPNFDLGSAPGLVIPPGNGTLELGDNLASLQNIPAITFSGTGNDLIFESSISPSMIFAIDGYQHGDTIDLRGVTGADTAVWTQNSGGSAGGTLSLDSATGTILGEVSLATGTFVSSLFSLTSDGAGGTDITVACYREGTNIATPEGEVAVECLAIGDTVLTADGTAKPVKWIGRRAYSPRFATGKPHILPIRLSAGALGHGRPRRDLWVSPQHAMLIDGALIPAACLVNGVSIVQEEATGPIVYVHVELDRHDVIFAEGAASETYINDGNRAMFHNAADYAERYRDDRTSDAWCAGRIEAGPVLETIRRRLAALAGAPDVFAHGPLTGWFERIETDAAGIHAVGWAYDGTAPDAAICLELVVNRHVVARGIANLHRGDLEDAGLGSGCHGFRIAIPVAASGAEIHIRRIADGVLLSSAIDSSAIRHAA
ncbi:MAG TPA: Hint domain-containing protein [Acidiphilium sp.]